MAIRARTNPFAAFFRPLKKREKMNITDYLDEKLITFLNVDTREKALEQLIDLLDSQGKLPNKQAFHRAITYREDLVSTGIGMGIAIPHAKMESIQDFFIAVGIQRQKGIEWNALDKAPVRIIFMIGGPENRQTEYLKILSMLTSAIKDIELKRKLLKVSSVEEAMKVFSQV